MELPPGYALVQPEDDGPVSLTKDGAVTGGLRLLGGGGDRALEHDILWSSYRYGTGAYSRSGVVCQEGERLVRYFVDCGDSGICELWLDRRRVLPVEEEQLLDRFTGMA